MRKFVWTLYTCSVARIRGILGRIRVTYELSAHSASTPFFLVIQYVLAILLTATASEIAQRHQKKEIYESSIASAPPPPFATDRSTTPASPISRFSNSATNFTLRPES